LSSSRTVTLKRATTGGLAACALAVLMLGLCGNAADAEPFHIITTETEIPLVPNSVIDLANRLGFYRQAGVEVELVRVQQTPSAVAALHSGEGQMANIGFDAALELLARGQMKLKGVISPDKALPFLLVAKKQYTTPKQLEGKVFGVARLGSVDYTLSRLVLAKYGASPDTLQYLAVGQPAVRAASLVAGRIDATTISIGTWSGLPDKSGLTLLVDEGDFYKAAPFVTKLNVVTDEVAQTRARDVQGVVRGIMMASRAFAADPGIWVDAMEKARPDWKRSDLGALAQAYRLSWAVNGGLNLNDLAFTSDMLYRDPEWSDLTRIAPTDWIDTHFVDAVLADSGTVPAIDPVGR
jgi:NitT/TauT family transport system substrate-binding protein